VAKQKEPERPDWESSNGGLMLWTSLNIILLAFFILLSSMAVIDEKREIAAMDSLLGAFGLLPGGQTPSGLEKGLLSPPSGPLSEIENDVQLIKEIMVSRIMSEKVHFLRGRTRRIISLESALLFPPDGVDLLSEMLPDLKAVAEILRESSYPITIEGHTDDQPPQSPILEDNWQVSALRAEAVLRFMIEEGGVDPKRLSAYGYAGYKPVVANTTPANRERNNRVDLVLDYTHTGDVKDRRRARRGERVFNFMGFEFKIFTGKTGQ
jgi:chemotaxis protein MotB